MLSTLAADGSVTTITTVGAGGSATGSHDFTTNRATDSWSQSGDYAAGNGAASTHASSNTSAAESMQSSWQEGYTLTACRARRPP